MAKSSAGYPLGTIPSGASRTMASPTLVPSKTHAGSSIPPAPATTTAGATMKAGTLVGSALRPAGVNPFADSTTSSAHMRSGANPFGTSCASKAMGNNAPPCNAAATSSFSVAPTQSALASRPVGSSHASVAHTGTYIAGSTKPAPGMSPASSAAYPSATRASAMGDALLPSVPPPPPVSSAAGHTFTGSAMPRTPTGTMAGSSHPVPASFAYTAAGSHAAHTTSGDHHRKHPKQEAPKEPRRMPPLLPPPSPSSGGLDICFVMDCTGSMKPWIDAAKATIQEMIRALDERQKRVAFVAYRDFANGLPEAFDFTSDINTIIGFINKQRATGGADFPEDVAGGLHAALGLSWAAETRSVVLVADAPCHGKKYATNHHHDDFPEGDPTGLSMTALLQAFRSSYIDFTFVQLTSETDRMQALLRESYERTPGCDNIRKYELRDLRQIIEEAGGAEKVSTEAAKVTSMLSAAVTPSVMASVASTRKGVAMQSVAIKSSYASYAAAALPAASMTNSVPPASTHVAVPRASTRVEVARTSARIDAPPAATQVPPTSTRVDASHASRLGVPASGVKSHHHHHSSTAAGATVPPSATRHSRVA